MPLNPSAMKDLIKGKIEAATGSPMPDISDAVWQAVCEGIIEHFVTNAQITSTVTVTSVTAVTPGVGVSGPGVGTATGTIT